ncbi:MAG: HAD hydrolase-like protein, partial [Promethearchaeota archaeon]
MVHPPIILFDFDGVIITQYSLEYTALILRRNKWFEWRNNTNLRLIDYARLFEECDVVERKEAIKRIYKVYKPYIPKAWKRCIFFTRFNRLYQKYEKFYEKLRPGLLEVIESFKKQNFLLGIISNTSRKRLNYFNKKLHLEEYFSVFISRDDSCKYKTPNPYPIILGFKK